MSFKPEEQKNTIIGIMGSIFFVFLTILVPLFRIFGGFLTYSSSSISGEWYWNEVSISGMISREMSYPEYVAQNDELSGLWLTIGDWGLFWIVLGFFGAFCIILPSIRKFPEKPIIGVIVPTIGLITGLLATVVEFGLFFLVLNEEDWGATTPDLNLVLLACFILGWIVFIISYYFSLKK